LERKVRESEENNKRKDNEQRERDRKWERVVEAAQQNARSADLARRRTEAHLRQMADEQRAYKQQEEMREQERIAREIENRYREAFALLRESIRLDPSLRHRLALFICDSISTVVRDGFGVTPIDRLRLLLRVADTASIHCLQSENPAIRMRASDCLALLDGEIKDREADAKLRHMASRRVVRRTPKTGSLVKRFLRVTAGFVLGIIGAALSATSAYLIYTAFLPGDALKFIPFVVGAAGGILGVWVLFKAKVLLNG
jgi:hypothetical protein